jgi:hypothetical protein
LLAGGTRWWTTRRAQSLKPASYLCPFCGERLPALSEHVLIAPEGDLARRRHAHTRCVIAARESGALPDRDEWRAGSRGRLRLLRRLSARLSSRPRPDRGGRAD